MSQRDLLLEIGCEELPSSSLLQLGAALGDLLSARLTDKKLSFGEVQWFAAPRRLAVLVRDLIEQGPDEAREALGPPVAQARDEDGNWSRAAQGFASKQGVSVDELESIDTPKGPRLGLRQVLPGARTADVLVDLVEETIKDLPIAKRMRWGASRREFARPVHWIVLLYGTESGFGPVMGIESGNSSRGHRFHAPGELLIDQPSRYAEILREAHVVADVDERRAAIRDQVTASAQKLGGEAVIKDALLDEVCSLVDWPVALAGAFDASFLDVPAEALISSMESHQKYFPVVDAAGALMPNFITVSNIESKDPAQVIAGNEKVIRPRLADAAFFFNQDRQHSLESRVTRLDDVVFQKKLGSVGDKGRRIAKLGALLAAEIGADPALTERAGLLAKADLVSDMVLEFSDLQGIAGAHYARHDGESPIVADAVEQHYWPKQAGSELPQSKEALALALADRLDTLAGIFGIGQPPSGSKDPFALRRASIAVLRMIIEQNLGLDLRACVEKAVQGFEGDVLEKDTVDRVIDYALDRLPALYADDAAPIEVFRAVRAIGCTAPADFDRRVRAVIAFGQRPEAQALAAANKRVSNILAKADDLDSSTEVSASLLVEAQEKDLLASLESVESENQASLADLDYQAALGRLAALREPVDAFFDGVMVNAEDPALRKNRLLLLQRLRSQFLAIADISQLAA